MKENIEKDKRKNSLSNNTIKNSEITQESFNYLNLYLKNLAISTLFSDMTSEALAEFWEKHKINKKLFLRNSFLISQGSPVEYIGIILDGKCQIVKEYENGNRLIVAELEPGDYFGESLYFSNIENSPVSVIAKEDAVVLRLTLEDLLSIQSLSSPASVDATQKFLQNLLKMISSKNLFLQERIKILSQKSIEDKVLTMLKIYIHKSQGIQKQKKKYVIIPMNREEMADYLAVDRTSLSHQLSKMKKKGVIDFYKNTFSLLLED